MGAAGHSTWAISRSSSISAFWYWATQPEKTMAMRNARSIGKSTASRDPASS